MKKIIITLVIITSFVNGFAQSDKYPAAMQKNLAAIEPAFANPPDMLALSNSFERIAVAEKNQWIPFYYAALLQVNYAFMQKDPSGNDALAAKATLLLNKADSLQPNNSEISTVRSMIGTVQMLVNPMQRFMEYSATIETNLQKAMKQDESNPRPIYVKAENLKNTPVNFGGGCTVALPLLKKALEKYNGFKAQNAYAPTWGQPRVEQLIKECEK